MYLNKETVDIQTELASYCKTGIYKPIEGIQESRVNHYRRLVIGNVKSTLERAYPITLEWLLDEEWLLLVNDFFEYHDAQSPKIWELPKEFMEFVKENDYATKLKKNALDDLLLIEWVEIEVHTMTDESVGKYVKEGNLIEDKLVLAPEYRLLRLDYPVHALNGDEAVEKKGDWFIYVFRNRETDGVQFLNISSLHVFVLEKLYEKAQSITSILPVISSIFGLNDVQQLKTHLQSFVSDLKKQGALLGVSV